MEAHQTLSGGHAGRQLALVLGLAAQAGCISNRVQYDPAVRDQAAAQAEVVRMRRAYADTRLRVHGCERRSPERCERDGKCETYIEFASHDQGGPMKCRASGDAIQDYLQERRRRRCALDRRTHWYVWKDGRADCICPTPSTTAFIRDGVVLFGEAERRCLTHREICRKEGGTLRSPSIIDDADAQALMGTPAPQTQSECEHASRWLDTDRARYLDARWVDGSCERTVLAGFRVLGDDEYEGSRESFDVEVHVCDRDSRPRR